MDISKFDARAKAEAGVSMHLCDEYTGEKLKDEDGSLAGFLVRGVASKTVQERMAAMQRKARNDDGEEEDFKAVLERIHENQIETAMGYIICGENLSIGDKEVGGKASLIRQVLNMTFPDMKIATDANGDQLTTSITDKEGNSRLVPKFEVVNQTFAAQVIKAAEDGQSFFARTAED